MGNNRNRGARSGWVRRDARAIWLERSGAARVEAYLQRAMEAERKGAVGNEEFRREMIDLAVQWRDLARLAAEQDS